jgi:hypothetical protein
VNHALKAGIVAAVSAIATTAAPAAVVVNSGSPGTTGATALYMNLPGEVSVSDGTATPAEIAAYLGAPDDVHAGLGEHTLTYDLGTYRLVDGAGQDFNVYEVDGGSVEFGSVDVLVSADGVTFFNVESTFQAAVNLAGDELHGNASFRRSYDIAGAVAALGASQFRFVRLDGTGGGPIGGDNDFDPDAVGFANFINLAPAIPEPATWAMMVGGFALLGGAVRRQRTSALA